MKYILPFIIIIAASCSKSYCYECRKTIYSNQEAVFSSVRHIPKEGYSYTLGSNPFTVDTIFYFDTCDPRLVENFESGDGISYKLDTAQMIYRGASFNMTYNVIQENKCILTTW